VEKDHHSAVRLPSALEKLKNMQDEPFTQPLALFLDYDGTLAPIVPRPEDARMPEAIRELIRQLASLCHVAIVSGRDRADVAQLVNLEELIYAGSHGFDISGPGGLHMQHPEGQSYLSDLDDAEQELNRRLSDVEGVKIERKKYAIAVHYRNVLPEQAERVQETVHQMDRASQRLKTSTGKKVIELRPALDWHKGKAVGWILEALQLDTAKVLPIFIGDDITDEDAFRYLAGTGMGILVGDHGEATSARYRLEDIDQVEQFLRGLLRLYKA
jgi:alpha,alpha-trehalase